MGLNCFGRKNLYTDVDEITDANVIQVLNDAIKTFESNAQDCDYLYQYYKGNQPILSRTDLLQPDKVQNIVENRANEIVSFKVGYLIGEPIQYVPRTDGESVAEGVKRINDYVFEENKAAKDKELVNWTTICGIGFRLVLPDQSTNQDDSPFEIYTLDPRHTFVVRHSGLGHKVKLGVTYTTKNDGVVQGSAGSRVYSVYTENKYYEIVSPNVTGTPSEIRRIEPHSLGQVPIFEYEYNEARQGAFEIVLEMLDAINLVDSNRVEGLQSFVHALMVLKGVDIESEDWKKLLDLGAIAIPKDCDAKYLVQELNQVQTQTLVDQLYATVLAIVGMPNHNIGSSDTGSAVILRNGWYAAEARAKDTELVFKKTERDFIAFLVRICNDLRGMNLKSLDVDIRFTRRNYENISEKVNVLIQLLSSDLVAPSLAFQTCGLFSDPLLAYEISMQYAQSKEVADKERLADSIRELTNASHTHEEATEATA